ncbi:MAG TPA: S8 family serine peptidase, partial [Candidatus Sulfotelmatobacter sp.]|nr:S8 family serine peptidase [Candidatus Sulfotelmatobacter sp.]
NSPKYYNDVLNRMATDNVAKQLSSSWGMHSSPNATSDQIFQQFAAQGQSFFQASGDWGAYAGPVLQPTDNPYITIVGGTTLSTAWSGGPWGAETTWKYNRNFGSGGGISTFYSIPTWQLGLDISASQGSTTMRTLPDVAMVADNIGVICNNGRQYKVAGTSAAAPLWAGFMALVNEQAANCNLPPIGFANPALYAIARGAGYSSSFHDIVAGNNTTSKNPNRFYAVPGYDLCTGWGTPIGQRLIDSLTFGGSALSVIPASGLTLTGKVGGPFDETAASFSLTDSGWEPVSWSSGTDAAWLELTPAAGTLNPDGSTTVATVSLNAAASNLLAGTYTANLWFTNLANGTAQNRALTLQVVPGGSLEVTINPPEAATAGAMWQVDGGPWQASGATVAGLTEGSHVVTFWPLWGWQSPGSQQVTLSRNQAATATGTYVQQFGSLRITLGPAAVVQAGVRWQVDGGPWLESGATVAGLAFGYHTVTFSPINGWKVPTMYSAYTGLGLTALMATYTPVSYGSLQVHLYPTNAPGVEARWQVDGGPWQESGATVACTVGVGHTVTFSSAEGWLPPSAQTVALTANGLTALTGVYAEPYSFTTIAGQTAYIGSDDGPGDTSRFYYPSGIAVDNSGNVFVTDRDNATIRHLRWTKTNWTVSTIAGLANSYDHLDGTNQGARFRSPSGITLDTNGTVYVADSGNYTVRRLSLQGTNWVVSTIAGLAGSWGNVDGPGSEARFGRLAGLTADRNGNLYVADSANYTIRKLTLEGTQWKVTSIAGKGFYGVADGIGTNAGFGDLRGISADGKGHLFVLDHGVMGIRQLTQTGADWVVTSVAGTPFQANPQDGFGPQASFNYPQGLGIDAQGNLYIGEYGAIRKVSPVGADWLVSTIGGPRGTSVDGVNKDAGFTLPMALATDAAGRVFVTDTSSHTIRLGTLAQAGALRVTLTPEEAAKAWAQWRVDGGAWHPSGDISYLPPGEHTLSFSTVFGWATP